MKFKNLAELRKALKLIGFNIKKKSYSEFSAIEYVYNTKEKESVAVMTKSEPGVRGVLLRKDCGALKVFFDENQKDLVELEKTINEESFSTTVGIYFTETMIAQS